MKHFLLFFLFCSTPLLFSQNIAYRYDASGNRIERVIIFRAQAKSKEEKVEETSIKDAVAEHKITIYPNPTKGLLSVEVSEYSDTTKTEYSLSNISGNTLLRQKGVSSLTSFDLTQYPSGIYLLLININGKQTAWKILKE